MSAGEQNGDGMQRGEVECREVDIVVWWGKMKISTIGETFEEKEISTDACMMGWGREWKEVGWDDR